MGEPRRFPRSPSDQPPSSSSSDQFSFQSPPPSAFGAVFATLAGPRVFPRARLVRLYTTAPTTNSAHPPSTIGTARSNSDSPLSGLPTATSSCTAPILPPRSPLAFGVGAASLQLGVTSSLLSCLPARATSLSASSAYPEIVPATGGGGDGVSGARRSSSSGSGAGSCDAASASASSSFKSSSAVSSGAGAGASSSSSTPPACPRFFSCFFSTAGGASPASLDSSSLTASPAVAFPLPSASAAGSRPDSAGASAAGVSSVAVNGAGAGAETSDVVFT
mmetsp:Transcript_15963/g.67307  ORF Transcript_15963/g.67307 Transcript_15963/m.67307 type:complete len:277 (-) Transcript_15963:684-1514(-)